MNKDLTVGKPSTVLRQFCLPLFGSIIFQQLYNIADSLVVGKFVGENALAAVGNSYEITLIFLAFAFGCNMGCSVIVSRLFGARKYGNMKTAVSTASLYTTGICVLMMALGLFGGDAMLRMIRTPEAVYADSKLYLSIYVYSLPFVFFYNVATGIFAALGDSKTPLYFLAVSSLSNIAVDILFVTAFNMGVAGVAWATFLCQGVSAVLAVVVVLRRLALVPSDEGERMRLFDGRLFMQIVSIAIPSTLQQSFISIGNIIIQSVINGFGPAVMAGYSATIKLNNLVITSFTTMGNGISNYTAQNLGANKLSRVRQGLKAGLQMVWVLCVPLSLLYMFGGATLLKLFLDAPSSEALKTGVNFLRIVAPFYAVVAAKLVSDGILRGSGHMKQFMVGTFTDLILRVVLAILLARTVLGATGIWCAWPIGWIVSAFLSLRYYSQGPWCKEELKEESEENQITE